MHIEINNGGLLGGASINDFQVDLDQFIGASNDILSAFKTIENSTYNLNGGVGSLEEAVEAIGARIREEEHKIEAAIEVQQKTIEFVALANRVDKQVADLVNQNKEEFYRTNPWLRPPVPVEDDRNFIEKGIDYVKDGLHEAGEAIKEAWEDTKEALKKCWDSIVEFYEEHKKIIDTILVVVGAVLAIAAVVATGGLGLVPLLGAFGCSVAVATTISMCVAVAAVVTTAVAAVLNVTDIWFEIDNVVFQKFKAAFNIASTVLNITYSIGSIYNAIKKTSPTQYIADHTPKQTYTNVDQLSQSQLNSLDTYSGNDYHNINNSLRGTETATPENAKVIKDLQNTLGNSSLPEDTILYRGTGMEELGDLANLPTDELVGKSFFQDGFLSTTRDQFVGSSWTKNLNITIHAPAGSPGLDITSISRHPNEMEVLFNSGRQMLITSAEKIKGITYINVILK